MKAWGCGVVWYGARCEVCEGADVGLGEGEVYVIV